MPIHNFVVVVVVVVGCKQNSNVSCQISSQILTTDISNEIADLSTTPLRYEQLISTKTSSKLNTYKFIQQMVCDVNS